MNKQEAADELKITRSHLNKVINKRTMPSLRLIKDMEDYLVYLKKGYEKDIVSFKDMLNLTRALSREIFNLNYMRRKIKSQEFK